MTRRTVVLSLLAGALASRLLEPLFFPIGPDGFRVHFGHVAFALLSVSAAGLYRCPPGITFWAALGASLDQLVFLIIATGGDARFYSTASITGSLLLVLAAMVSAGVVSGERIALPARTMPPWRDRVFAVAAMTLTVIAFRWSLSLMVAAGIDDSQRSIVVAGYDIHHINFGILLIWLGAIVLRAGMRRLALLATAPGLGMLIDQLGYYALTEVNDATYFGAVSQLTAGAGLAVAALVIVWPQRERTSE